MPACKHEAMQNRLFIVLAGFLGLHALVACTANKIDRGLAPCVQPASRAGVSGLAGSLLLARLGIAPQFDVADRKALPDKLGTGQFERPAAR